MMRIVAAINAAYYLHVLLAYLEYITDITGFDLNGGL
jgi:hypothetical protein